MPRLAPRPPTGGGHLAECSEVPARWRCHGGLYVGVYDGRLGWRAGVLPLPAASMLALRGKATTTSHRFCSFDHFPIASTLRISAHLRRAIAVGDTRKRYAR